MRGAGAPLRAVHAQDGQLLCHVDDAEHAGDELGEDRRPGRARAAHVEIEDEDEVQHDVQRRGEDQEVERAPAVAQRAHDGGGKIIEDRRRDARQDHDEVGIGVLEDVCRRLHPDEDVARQEHRHDRDDDRHGQRDPGTVGHVAAQVVLVLRAEALRHGDGKPRARARAEANDQELQGADGAHRRKGVHAQVLADDDGVHHAVHLLEQVAEDERQRKGQDVPDRPPVAHIPCQVSRRHENPSFSK